MSDDLTAEDKDLEPGEPEFDPVAAARQLWNWHREELPRLENIYEHLHERRGLPNLPKDVSEEVKRIRDVSFMNVLSLVRDAFAQNLSVVGFRSNVSGENSPAWSAWQRNRMDARQAEIYRPALTYGASYVAVLADEQGRAVFRPRSPRQMIAVYADSQVDEWPEMALEMWYETRGRERILKGNLFTETMVYPLWLGRVMAPETAPKRIMPRPNGEPFAHGASHCPVVRFVNQRDTEEVVVGEVEPLLNMQKQINEVNFDRLIVSRFGAFPQKVISGWQGTAQEVLAASARRVWTFEDPDVKAQSFAAADPAAYTAVINDKFEHVAMLAQISPAQVTGQIVNVSAEALAAAEANQQRKLSNLRESYGESIEQMLRLAAEIEGNAEDATDDEAEVIWRDTEARSFGAIVDGVTKLAATGVPVVELLHMVPGMTQQAIRNLRALMKTQTLMQELREKAEAAKADPTVADLANRTVPATEGGTNADPGGNSTVPIDAN
ncbi:phage portal protein [Rhodococcus sp. 06-156-3C]|uniref:phage portal protein n=1 Tax=Rhodococcus sp. 06-156-3C TaxID=2022486 RepID=UPI00159500EE|nr:phage portal protein [Rhodococcus sp. 06-156-3C]